MANSAVVKFIDLPHKIDESPWTYDTLADHLGIHPNHLWKVINGHRNIVMPLALRLAQMFGPLVVEMNGVRFTLVPGETAEVDGHSHISLVGVAGTRRKVRRPKGVSIPVQCMVALREIGQLDKKLREIEECMLDVEMGRAGAEQRLVTLVKEAQEAWFWIAVLLQHIGERHPEVLDSGTDLAVSELMAQLGLDEAA